MKNFKEYKGVAILFVVVTLICSLWVIGYDRCDINKQVNSEKDLVVKV